MRAPVFLMMMVVGALAGCVSGVKSPDTYTDRSGKTSVIESDREQCERSCNADYARCMDATSARSSSVNGPSGMFGASADCRSSLSSCLSGCRAR